MLLFNKKVLFYLEISYSNADKNLNWITLVLLKPEEDAFTCNSFQHLFNLQHRSVLLFSLKGGTRNGKDCLDQCYINWLRYKYAWQYISSDPLIRLTLKNGIACGHARVTVFATTWKCCFFYTQWRKLTSGFMKQKGLKILHQNVRGLLCNLPLIQKFLYTHQNTDVFCCSEMHIKDYENIHDLYKVEGYDFVSRNRATGNGGGVGVYVKKTKRRLDY